MPNKSDEEIRESIKKFKESLSSAEHNPDTQNKVEGLIERTAQSLSSKGL